MKLEILALLAKGNTYLRSYLDPEIFKRCKSLNGKCLDLGCGKTQYSRIFDKNAKIVTCDIDPLSGADLIFDANEKFPIKRDEFDNVFCMNVVEHLKEPGTCIDEIHRILKPRGRVYLSAVFFYNFHCSPGNYYDYYRFTHEGILHLLKKAGFKKITIERLGGRGSILVDTLVSLMPLKFLATLIRIVCYPIVWILDDIIRSRMERKLGKIYYLTSFIVAEK